MSNYHIPVLASESIEALDIKPNGTYVDATFGGGGHSKLILEKLDKGQLIAFDMDSDAAKNIPDDERLLFVNHNYGYIKQFLDYLNIDSVDGILADLGISSYQIDTPERGFAHRFEGVVDMRMNIDNNISAKTLLNEYSEESLTHILREYGELPNAKRIAHSICLAREIKPIETTTDLTEILKEFEKPGKQGQFRSQVFQALRIEVNQELEGLKNLLINGCNKLKKNGRFVIISYHSLEDRLVKNFFKAGNFEGNIEKDFYGVANTPLKPLSGKSIIPGVEETKANNRARSAKMRVGIKVS
ncbi:MAG: 16S rRNA (cytosine(1402)-N(4))-methyltransferase RsmH [Bacteroidia bacterium]|nr:16S rRNA (cytosine(1402)-N(4))-methyltransferase RsmH [Bacteroidia bacterium]